MNAHGKRILKINFHRPIFPNFSQDDSNQLWLLKLFLEKSYDDLFSRNFFRTLGRAVNLILGFHRKNIISCFSCIMVLKSWSRFFCPLFENWLEIVLQYLLMSLTQENYPRVWPHESRDLAHSCIKFWGRSHVMHPEEMKA